MPDVDDNRPYAWIKINDIEIKGLLDSGSNRTLISYHLFLKMSDIRLETLVERIELRSADGGLLSIVGEVHISVDFNEKVRLIPALVVKNLSVLGMTFWTCFNIYPQIGDMEQN